MSELKDFANSLAIVVSSCDKFFDAWRPFAFFFRKFWPDCPFPVYLITNHLEVRSSWVRPLSVGTDRGWATNLENALSRIDAPYILYTQEDYFLNAPVDGTRLAEDLDYALEHKAASFRFFGRDPETDLTPLNERFGTLGSESDWRTLCQVTLWKRDALRSILRPGETAWDFESRASERTSKFLSLSYARGDGPISYLRSAIVRGLWAPEALALCDKHNFEIRPHFRPTYVSSRAGRRVRRAVGRMTYAAARGWQSRKAIGLDAKQ